jgi:hypothetical protein
MPDALSRFGLKADSDGAEAGVRNLLFVCISKDFYPSRKLQSKIKGDCFRIMHSFTIPHFDQIIPNFDQFVLTKNAKTL